MARMRTAKFFEITGPRGGRRVAATQASSKSIEQSKKRAMKAGFTVKSISENMARRLGRQGIRRGSRAMRTGRGGIVIAVPRKRR